MCGLKRKMQFDLGRFPNNKACFRKWFTLRRRGRLEGWKAGKACTERREVMGKGNLPAFHSSSLPKCQHILACFKFLQKLVYTLHGSPLPSPLLGGVGGG
jgi:hypothetical protein